MNLDELRSVQSKERRKDSLQQLRDSFYQDVAAYIEDLRAERDRRAEQVDNPFSDDEVGRLSDELDTAEEVAESLYERRVGKVVKLASFAAADMSADREGLTAEEQELFDDLVDRIKRNKANVLDVLAGESGSPATGTADSGAATDTTESSTTPPTESMPTDDEPTTIGGENAEGAKSPPTPPEAEAEAEAEADEVLANAMGGETDPESAGEQEVSRDFGSDADDGTDGTDGDGVPTTDGGSTTQPTQSGDSPESPAGPSPSASEQTPSTADTPQAGETDTSQMSPAEPAGTPSAEPSALESQPPGESTPAQSTATHSTPAQSTTTQSSTSTTTATTDTDSPEAAGTASQLSAEPPAEPSEPAQSATTDTDSSTATATADAAESSSRAATDSEVVAAEQSSDPAGEAATATESVERTTVRVTDHVGTILGTDDREYTLRQEDVVTLPAANAEALLSRDAAVELE